MTKAVPPWDVATMLAFWVIGLFFYPAARASSFYADSTTGDVPTAASLFTRVTWFVLWLVGYRLSAIIASWLAILVNTNRDPSFTARLQGRYYESYKRRTLILVLY